MTASVAASEPLLTRQFGVVMAGTACSWLAHSMAIMMFAPFVAHLGFDPAFGGLGLGVLAIAALMSRMVVAPRIDRREGRAPVIVGAALIMVGGLGYLVTASGMLGGMAALGLAGASAAVHGAGFGVMTTSSFTIVGDVAPVPRRGEALGLYGTAQPIIQGLAATLGFAIVGVAGFIVLYGGIVAAAAASTLLFRWLKVAPPCDPEPVHAARAGRPIRAVGGPVLACGMLSVVGGALVLTVPLLGSTAGLANPGVFYLATAVTGVLARLATGRVSDRWGRVRVAAPGLLLLTGSVVLLVAWAGAGIGVFMIAGGLYGIASAAALPALQALILDRSPAHRRGTSAAAMGMALDVGFASGSVMTGAIVGLAGAGPALLAASAAPLISVGLLLVDARWMARQPARPR